MPASAKPHPTPLPAHLVWAQAGKPSPAEAYLNTLSPSGRRTQATALANLAGIFSEGKLDDPLQFAWENLRYEQTSSLAAYMVDIGYAKSSVNKHLVVLRRVLEEAYRLGLYSDHNSYYQAAAVRSLRNESLPRGRALKEDELQALVAACLADGGNPNLGVRDAALISTLYVGALRRQEVVDLNLADLSVEEARLRVQGKGSKRRYVYLSPSALLSLQSWLDLRGRRLGPLFCRVSKGGKIGLRRLSPQAIYYLLGRRALQAGLEAFSPHDLRRTAITHLLDAEVDVLTVSAIAGHASTDTTRRYDRRSEESKRAAAQKLRAPLPPGSPDDGPGRESGEPNDQAGSNR